MCNRREFVAAATGGMVLTGLGVVPAMARTHGARRVGGSPTKAVFEGLQGQDFQLHVGDGERVALNLVAVRDRASRQPIEQFSLVLRGSEQRPIDGGTYRMEHAQSGNFQLRLDPSGRSAKGQLYRADFSLLV